MGPADTRLLAMLGLELPILQAPMAGIGTPALAIAVCEAGGLGALPGAQYAVDGMREALRATRAGTARPLNLNFFTHRPDPAADARQPGWVQALAPYYAEAGLPPGPGPAASRPPFGADHADIVEEFRPEVVSFHFGLPEPALLDRVRATGARILSTATTVAEAEWLEANGADAIIAQGAEAGGHQGHFLDPGPPHPIGTLALVPQIVDAVRLPVIAAGGIADRRGVEAAFALGAAAAQVGTAYLLTPEAGTPSLHRAALLSPRARQTALTNLFTGRPARGILNRLMRELGPLSAAAPPFPTAAAALAPLRAAAEAQGRDDFTTLWAGQAAPLARPMGAFALTRLLGGA